MKAGPPSRAVDLEQRVAELAMKHGAFDLGWDGSPAGWKYMNIYDIPSLKLSARTWKWRFPIGISFSRGLFSVAMLVLGRVIYENDD